MTDAQVLALNEEHGIGPVIEEMWNSTGCAQDRNHRRSAPEHRRAVFFHSAQPVQLDDNHHAANALGKCA
jgi:hypothetical protein